MLRNLFGNLKGKRVLLLCHEHADLDSFCSASIMHELLSAKKVSSTIAVPSHINDAAFHFARENKISFEVNPNLEEFDEIFLFDLNGYEQLGSLGRNFINLNNKCSFMPVVFDHHVLENNSISKSKETICRDCLSTTQLLFRLFGGDKNFSKKCAFFACIGIIEDTGRFTVGSEGVFADFAVCLKKAGCSFANVVSFTKQNFADDEKIAFIKAAQRAQLTQIRSSKKDGGKILVVTSELSFYQSESASMLLNFGADIALVAGEERTGLSTLSCRAETIFKEYNRFNLVNDLLKPLQKSVGGEIGGHSGAAQWKGHAESKKVLSECIEILKKVLSS